LISKKNESMTGMPKEAVAPLISFSDVFMDEKKHIS